MACVTCTSDSIRQAKAKLYYTSYGFYSCTDYLLFIARSVDLEMSTADDIADCSLELQYDLTVQRNGL